MNSIIYETVQILAAEMQYFHNCRQTEAQCVNKAIVMQV